MVNIQENIVSTSPLVSVVIGVHNGGADLEPTLHSVLDQQNVDFEVIVVDDGSSDQTADVLERLAGIHPNLRVFHQTKNVGLTKALILGCLEARGKFIARQDVGDISLPGRMCAQVLFLEKQPSVVLSSCWTRIVGPEQEYLGANCPSDSPDVATNKLLGGQAGVTHHGAVMFRADAYHLTGGYRSEFYFAQDLDLWYRLLQFGKLAFLPAVLYEVQITTKALSSRYRNQQIALASIIRQLAYRETRESATEAELLIQASQIRPETCPTFTRNGMVSGEYWIASMLILQSDPRAARYLIIVIRQRPLFLKAWFGFIRLAISMIRKSIRYLIGKRPHESSASF